MTEWISADTPPKKPGRYLCAKRLPGTAGSWLDLCHYDEILGWYYIDDDWGDEDGVVTVRNVAYWMPLPDAPEAAP